MVIISTMAISKISISDGYDRYSGKTAKRRRSICQPESILIVFQLP